MAIDGPSGSLSNSVNCVSVRLRPYSIRFSSIAMNPQSSVLKYYGCGSAKNFSIFFLSEPFDPMASGTSTAGTGENRLKRLYSDTTRAAPLY